MIDIETNRFGKNIVNAIFIYEKQNEYLSFSLTGQNDIEQLKEKSQKIKDVFETKNCDHDIVSSLSQIKIIFDDCIDEKLVITLNTETSNKKIVDAVFDKGILESYNSTIGVKEISNDSYVTLNYTNNFGINCALKYENSTTLTKEKSLFVEKVLSHELEQIILLDNIKIFNKHNIVKQKNIPR